MAAYAVGLYNMQDRSWLPAYQGKVTALIAKHGGRYIARASKCPWDVRGLRQAGSRLDLMLVEGCDG
jgi:uncharacterized protein DUF1330